jgi:hypothetical protein
MGLTGDLGPSFYRLLQPVITTEFPYVERVTVGTSIMLR